MTKIIVACWMIALVLALDHLLFLAAYDVSLELVVALAVALSCFSLPFYLLTLLRPPPGRRLKTVVALSLAACIVAINLYIPLRRFLPGYHPEPLEALIYLVAPLAEALLVAIALGVL